MSAQVILLSLFLYFPWSRRYLSMAETKADLAAFSGGAAVLQPGGVVVVLDDVHLVGEAAGHD